MMVCQNEVNPESFLSNFRGSLHFDTPSMGKYGIIRNYNLYSARTVNSAPEAKSRPFCEERAVKRR